MFSQAGVSYDYYDTKLQIFLEENFGQESRESQLGENDARDAILNHESNTDAKCGVDDELYNRDQGKHTGKSCLGYGFHFDREIYEKTRKEDLGC